MIVKDVTQRHSELAHVARHGQPDGQAEVKIALQSDYLRYNQYRIPHVASKSLRHHLRLIYQIFSAMIYVPHVSI